MGVFVITRNANGQYYFALKAGNGETLLLSEEYSSKPDAINGINSVISNASREERYERKTTSNGKHYFILKAANGQVIGTSELYESTIGRDRGIASVKTNALGGQVVDEAAISGSEDTISRFVKEKRRLMRLTQEELALKAGVGLRFIRELEGGEKRTFRIDKVNQVLQLFGYTLKPTLIDRQVKNKTV